MAKKFTAEGIRRRIILLSFQREVSVNGLHNRDDQVQSCYDQFSINVVLSNRSGLGCLKTLAILFWFLFLQQSVILNPKPEVLPPLK